MATIVVGGIVKKDNKYLLVQEAQERCRGKWNIPAGHLDPNETVMDGAKREVFEECGYNVEITGIAKIGNRLLSNDEFMGIVFSTKIIDGNINYDPAEILDVKWFTYDEILNMEDELRSKEWIISSIEAVENNNTSSLDLIKVIK